MTNTDIIDLTNIVAMQVGVESKLKSVKVTNNEKSETAGSCFKFDRNHFSIEINIAGIETEEYLLEIIAHELAHIKHMNHSKKHKDLTRQYLKIVKEFN